MKRVIIGLACLLCTPVLAADKAAAPEKSASAVDMSKFGPATRKPTNESQTKKEINAFWKEEETLMTKGDWDGLFARLDYPVYMLTDDASGTIETGTYTKEQYVAMMKPMMENMPKDMKMTHKPTITVLSDNMAVVVDEMTMTLGKTRNTTKNTAMLVKKNGSWLWKTMAEAGWGGMGHSTGTGGGAAPTKTP
jgi:hypothetical protein